MVQDLAVPLKRKSEKESSSEKYSSNEAKSAIDAGKIEGVVQNQISRIRNELLCATSLPFLAILGIGGSPTLYALAFGSVASYVMDLLESLEGTMVTFVLMMFALIGTLIYASREFLSSSINNMTIIPVFGMILFYMFMVLLTQFNAFMFDMGYLMKGALQIVYLTMPLFVASLLSTVLTFSLPDIDLHLAFILIYFAYVLLLGYPKYITRKYFYKANSKSATTVVTHSELLLSFPFMKLVYAIPIPLSILLHYSLHHNVLTSVRTEAIQWIYVVCLPCYLMLFCYQQHLPYYQLAAKSAHIANTATSSTWLSSLSCYHTLSLQQNGWLSILSTSCLLGLIVPLYNHPVLDELKAFSGLPEPLPSYLVLAIIGLLIFSQMVLQRLQAYHQLYTQVEQQQDSLHFGSSSTTNKKTFTDDQVAKQEEEETIFQMYSLLPSAVWMFCLRIGLDVMVAMMIGLVCTLFHIPTQLIPIHMICGVSIMEFHFLGEWFSMTKGLLGLIAVLSSMVSILSLLQGTVFHIQYVMVWADYIWTCTFPQWCHLMTALVAGSVVLPSLLPSKPIFSHKALRDWLDITQLQHTTATHTQETLLPTTTTTTAASTTIPTDSTFVSSDLSMGQTGIGSNVLNDASMSYMFAWGSIALYAGIVFVQLLILEQDWTAFDANMTSEMVYPVHFFTLTTCALGGMAFVLYQKQFIGFSTALTLLTMTCGSYFGYNYYQVSSKTIFFFILFGISNCLPFTRQLSAHLKHTAAMETGQSTSTSSTTASPTPYVMSKNYLSWMELLGYIVLNGVTCVYINHDVSLWILQQVLQKTTIAKWQEYAFSLSIWCLFMSNIGYIFYRKYKIVRSIIFSLGILGLLLAFEGFGMLVITKNTLYFEDNSTILDSTPHHNQHHHGIPYHEFLLTPEHTEFFVFLSGVLTVMAWLRYVSVDNIITCLVYALIFAFISTKGMIPWVFPRLALLQSGFLPHTWTWYVPFGYLYLNKFFNTFFAQWNPPNYDTQYPTLFAFLFSVTVGYPVIVWLVSVLWYEVPLVISHGIIWSAIVGTGLLTSSLRIREVLQYIRYDNVQKEMALLRVTFWGAKKRSATSTTTANRQTGYSAVYLTACLTILWTLVAIALQASAIDSDVLLPGIALVLFCCERTGIFFVFSQEDPADSIHTPIMVWCLVSATWWCLSMGYHLGVYGNAPGEMQLGLTGITPTSLWGWDENNVSYWTNESWFTPTLNLFLGCATLPGLFLSYQQAKATNAQLYRRGSGGSGGGRFTMYGMELFVVFAIISVAPIIGGSLDCIRYLGLMSCICCAYHAYVIPKQFASYQSQEPYL